MKNIIIFIFLILFVSVSLSLYSAETVNKIIAIVNEEVITQQDVDQLLAVMYAQYVQAYSQEELLEKMEELKKDILKQMIDDKLVLSRAKELNIDVAGSEIIEKLDYVKSGFLSEKEFYEMLETQGITVANLKSRYTDQIMMKKAVDLEVKARVSVLPSEITQYYEAHREEFKRAGKNKVRHLLIKASDEVSFDLAKVEIDGIYNKLLNGSDFSELAKESSEGPNKDEGGDMGYIDQGTMRKELDEAIFSLRQGEFSKPVKSDLGYHIFKVEDIQNTGYYSLEEIQAQLKQMLFQKKFKEKLDEWLAGLREKAYISIK